MPKRSKSRRKPTRKVLRNSRPKKYGRSHRVKMGVKTPPSPMQRVPYRGHLRRNSPDANRDRKSPDSTMEKYQMEYRRYNEEVPEVEQEEEEYFPMEMFDQLFDYAKYLCGVTNSRGQLLASFFENFSTHASEILPKDEHERLLNGILTTMKQYLGECLSTSEGYDVNQMIGKLQQFLMENSMMFSIGPLSLSTISPDYTPPDIQVFKMPRMMLLSSFIEGILHDKYMSIRHRGYIPEYSVRYRRRQRRR